MILRRQCWTRYYRNGCRLSKWWNELHLKPLTSPMPMWWVTQIGSRVVTWTPCSGCPRLVVLWGSVGRGIMAVSDLRNTGAVHTCSELGMRSIWDRSKSKAIWNVNVRMRTEIDLNECEHFLKTNLGRFGIDPTCVDGPINGHISEMNQVVLWLHADDI